MGRNLRTIVAALFMLATAMIVLPTFAAPAAERRIDKGDRLKVAISDLAGPGTETKKELIVDKDGAVDLPFLKKLAAAGRTEAELERDIVEAYREARILERAQVAVTLEAKDAKKDGAK